MTSRPPFGARRPAFDRARTVIRDAVAERVCPAAVVEAGGPAGAIWREAFGTLTYDPGAPRTETDTIFDLASLTKVIATTTLVMRLVESGALSLSDRVAEWIPAWRGDGREDVRLEDLLAHASGLPDTRPLYERASGNAAIERAICEMPLEYAPRTASCYSDLGFILLGFIVEAAGRRPLGEQFHDLAALAIPAWDLRFGITERWRERTAPTQVDAWRGRLLQGEVDDRNAAALGGKAGHSGLFGTAAAAGDFARSILAGLAGRPGAFSPATTATIARFVRRVATPGSSRALGWDTMLPSSSCGSRMSPEAFGHTGFTGTSLWIDPEAPVYVVLLTNRVHPIAGPPEPIQALRRSLHDAVMDELSGG
jgi:CubicO group peptidase (beta-lactamase class C family)